MKKFFVFIFIALMSIVSYAQHWETNKYSMEDNIKKISVTNYVRTYSGPLPEYTLSIYKYPTILAGPDSLRYFVQLSCANPDYEELLFNKINDGEKIVIDFTCNDTSYTYYVYVIEASDSYYDFYYLSEWTGYCMTYRHVCMKEFVKNFKGATSISVKVGKNNPIKFSTVGLKECLEWLN